MFFKKHQNIFLILTVFLIVEFLIKPIGEFCLNDDWAYAASVKILTEKGVFEIGHWPAMTLLAHTLWGFLFIKIFGFSFTVLRVSVLILSFLTLCCTEKLIYKITNSRSTALIMSLLLLLNPLYLSLSNSYMTDISFICFFILSLFSFYLFYTSFQLKYVFVGFAFALIAVFIRQIGIILPIGFLVIASLNYVYNKEWRKIVMISFFLSATLFFLLFLFENYLSLSLKDGYCFQGLFYSKKPIEISLMKGLENFYVRLGLLFLYGGLFFFPVLIGKAIDIWSRLKNATILSKIVVSVFMLLIVFVFHYFPYGNYLFNCGVGLETTMDAMELDLNLDRTHFDSLFMIIKILSVIGNCLLIGLMFSFSKPLAYFKELLITKPFLVFVIVLLIFHQALLTYSSSFFDRYTVCFFVLCLTLLVYRFPNFEYLSKVTVICLCFYGCFSVMAVSDYFNYNRGKTKLINDLREEKNLQAKDINGGFEYTMWNSYSTNGMVVWSDPYKDHVISFSSIDGYHKTNYYSYRRYIPFKIDTIFVLQKDAK